MNVGLLFGLIALIFVGAALTDRIRNPGPSTPRQRTWLLMGGIFAVVSLINVLK